METSERIRQIEKLLLAEPDDLFLQYALALEYYKSSEVVRAVDLLESLRSRAPEYIATYYQLALMYIEVGRVDKAKDVITKGLEVSNGIDNKAYNELKLLEQDLD